LALAILTALRERPMHPYDLLQTMRPRYWDRLFGATTGSLYRAVERLARLGLVETAGTTRSGRRPERTVYEITDAGREALADQLAEKLARPAEEYPEYLLALTLSSTLPRDVALRELRRRHRELAKAIAGNQAMLDSTIKDGLPEHRALDLRYHLAMQQAEQDWTAQVIEDLERGRLEWPDPPP
jgi:DNA-binding PadR family transcriptional regulator